MINELAVGIWLSLTPACDNPSTSVPIYYNRFNAVSICAKTPLPVCGITYRLLATEDVMITYRYSDFSTTLEYTQPFPIPSHMYSTGLDWGWTIIPAAISPFPQYMLERFVLTTPVDTMVTLQDNAVLVMDVKKFETACYNVFEYPMNGKLLSPTNLRITK